MKRLILPAALALVFAGGAAFAQTADGTQAPAPIQRGAGQSADGPNPMRQTARMAKMLNLTPDQTAKVEPILVDRDQKIAALKSDTTLSDQVRHKQMHAIQKSSVQQLSGVLTPDQMQQLKAMRHEHKGGEQQPSAPATAPPAA